MGNTDTILQYIYIYCILYITSYFIEVSKASGHCQNKYTIIHSLEVRLTVIITGNIKQGKRQS